MRNAWIPQPQERCASPLNSWIIQESIRVRGFLTDPKLHTGSLLLNASWHSRNSQITKTVCKQLWLWRIEHKVIDATEEGFSKVPTGGSECHLSETHLFSFYKFYWSIVDSQCCVHFETHFEIHNALTVSFGARSEKNTKSDFQGFKCRWCWGGCMW